MDNVPVRHYIVELLIMIRTIAERICYDNTILSIYEL